MRLGLFTPVFNSMTLSAMLEELKRYPEIRALELGTGAWPGSSHLDVDALLADSEGAYAYRSRLEDAGIVISALSCHGNPVHPNVAIAREHDTLFRKTITLAERMHVPTVITFSGCPGGSAQDATPNWVTVAWPPEYAEALAWQWEERLIPYWREATRLCKEAGVRVALEAHPGFCVYNPETLLRLRAAAGDHLGINLDPSHMWWQGIDIPTAIAALGDAIFHFHAKDVAIHPAMRSVNGVLDAKSYREMAKRSWLFRSVGCGHGELEWKQIIAALRLVEYDGVLSIEHEDALASIHEGLSSAVAFLSPILLREPAVEAWWT